MFVVEVNDNPNIDAGVEDAVLKDDLYRAVIGALIRRLEPRLQPQAKAAASLAVAANDAASSDEPKAEIVRAARRIGR